MRSVLVMLALCAAPAIAAADARTRELAQGYDKELGGCRTRADGITRVTAGTQALVDAGQKQFEPELAALRDGVTELQAYCAELTQALALLADANASYRALERKLDEQDNKIRKHRAASKKALDDLAPVISRMIPQINARAGTVAPAPKRIRVKFPSERVIDAPVLSGTYRVAGTDTADILDYTEAKPAAKPEGKPDAKPDAAKVEARTEAALNATITVSLVAGATCEQRRHAVSARDAADVVPSDATRPLGLAWYVAYAKDTRRVRVACRDTKSGAVEAKLDEPTAEGWPELEPVFAAMIASRT